MEKKGENGFDSFFLSFDVVITLWMLRSCGEIGWDYCMEMEDVGLVKAWNCVAVDVVVLNFVP